MDLLSNRLDPRLASAGKALGEGIGAPGQSAKDLNRLTQQADFAGILASQKGKAGTLEEQAKQAAEDFVSVALVQPILKQLRDSNKAAPPYGPGPGEKQFRTLADAQMARNLVRSSNWSLVDRLAKQMLRTTDAVQPGSPADIRRRDEARAKAAEGEGGTGGATDGVDAAKTAALKETR